MTEIADEHIITRQNKRYVLYEGLLNVAHGRGLREIDTELLQVPAADNGNVAIVRALAKFEDGQKFSGIGDASPENVGRNIVPHIIRMAETRAKARALRDGVNIAEALADDPTVEVADAAPAQQGTRQAVRQGQRRSAGRETSEGQTSNTDNVRNLRGAAPRKNEKVSPETVVEILSLADKLYGGEVDPATAILDKLEERSGRRPAGLNDLTKADGNAITNSLRRAIEEERAEAEAHDHAAGVEQPDGEEEEIEEEEIEDLGGVGS